MFWLDTTILALLGLGAVLGAISGFLWQVARIACLALAVYAAILLNEWTSSLIAEAMMPGTDPRISRGLAYLGVFVAVFLILYQVVWLLDLWIQAVRLEPFNRFLGAIVGAAKMGLLAAAACLGLTHYSSAKTKEMLDQSQLAPVLVAGMDSVLLVIPQEFKNEVAAGWNQFREFAKNRTASPSEGGAKKAENQEKTSQAPPASSPDPVIQSKLAQEISLSPTR